MGKGNNRDWGYASYDVDNPDNGKLTYTSYEKSGSVNRYTDNGDGGHSHYHWNDSNSYNTGKDANYGRSESNSSKNPTTGEVQNNGGCFLTSACMQHFHDAFDDNCYELRVLRWFRDNYVSKDDIEHYYETAPFIVEGIENEEKKDIIYDYIYDNVIDYCVEQIENGNYNEAYNRYKNSILIFEKTFAKSLSSNKFTRKLKLSN